MNVIFNKVKKQYPDKKDGWLILDDDKEMLVYHHKASKSGIVFVYHSTMNKFTITIGKMNRSHDFDLTIMDEDDGFFTKQEMLKNVLPKLDEIFTPGQGIWKTNKIPFYEKKEIKERGRKAIPVNVTCSGIDFRMSFHTDFNDGPITFIGTREEFAKFLQKLKACDSLTKPKMKRQFTYLEMVHNIIEGKDNTVYIWDNILNNIRGTIFTVKTIHDIFNEEYSIKLKGD